MLDRWSPYLLLLVGALLLAAPALWQPSVPYATVTYDATPVESTDTYIQLDGGALTGPIEGLDCYGPETSRYCTLERYVAENGPITLETDSAPYHNPTFVAAGGFYRTQQSVDGETLTLSVEPVSPSTVLESIARPASELPPSARESLETEAPVTTRIAIERLNRDDQRPTFFVAAEDGYYLVSAHYVAHHDGVSPLETPVKGLSFLLGLGLVLRGGAKRRRLGDAPF